MNKIRGIAWDDEPDRYMKHLKEYLANHGIDLSVFQSVKKFDQAFFSNVEDWDFAVTDLIDKRDKPSNLFTGLKLAQKVASAKASVPSFPIYLLSVEPEKIHGHQAILPFNVLPRYKAEPDYVAHYIKVDLELRGIFVNRQNVFQIHCSHNQTYEKYGKKLREQLKSWDLTPITVSPETNLQSEIMAGLIQKMNGCGAIIAVCTADDEDTEGMFHPRENVLIEIGIALGLNSGLKRLIILQQIGKEKNERVELSSDLKGILTIPFELDITSAFSQVKARLKALRLSV